MKPVGEGKTFVSKKGRKVVFRYPLKEDFEQVWGYACDLAAEDTTVELSGDPPSREDERTWFDQMLKDMEDGNKIYLAVLVDGIYAGSGEVRRGRLRHRHVGEIGLSLGSQFRSEGIGTELLSALINEARLMGLRLLTINCFETNASALHVYEKLGFKTAGIIPGAIAFKGGFVGEVKLYLPLAK
jgi:RimJ/RimL family protein N-acetyltransferase